MSTVRCWPESFLPHFIRCFPGRHSHLFKLIVSMLAFTSLFVVMRNSTFDRPRPVEPSLSRSKVNSSLLQNLIITKLNASDRMSSSLSTVKPLNYLDPFVYSRIEFTHNDQRRSELSQRWCQAQSKFIRPQDLEPFKCLNVKQFPNSDHVFCLDPFIRNSCLIMSVSMGNNRLDDPFLSQLYDWAACRLFTLDPYQQPVHTNSSDLMITVKPNWTYYRLGLTASAAVDDHSNLMTIGKLADFIRLDSISARIDIFMLDIDNANEWNLLDDNDFFLYLCRHVKQLIVKTKPIYSKRFQHYRIFTLKLNKCFSLLRRRSRLYLLGRHDQLESEWSLTTFSLNLGLFCDEIDMSMYLLVYGQLYLVNTKL